MRLIHQTSLCHDVRAECREASLKFLFSPTYHNNRLSGCDCCRSPDSHHHTIEWLQSCYFKFKLPVGGTRRNSYSVLRQHTLSFSSRFDKSVVFTNNCEILRDVLHGAHNCSITGSSNLVNLLIFFSGVRPWHVVLIKSKIIVETVFLINISSPQAQQEADLSGVLFCNDGLQSTSGVAFIYTHTTQVCSVHGWFCFAQDAGIAASFPSWGFKSVKHSTSD